MLVLCRLRLVGLHNSLQLSSRGCRSAGLGPRLAVAHERSGPAWHNVLRLCVELSTCAVPRICRGKRNTKDSRVTLTDGRHDVLASARDLECNHPTPGRGPESSRAGLTPTPGEHEHESAGCLVGGGRAHIADWVTETTSLTEISRNRFRRTAKLGRSDGYPTSGGVSADF
jgi:hypothetical protein